MSSFFVRESELIDICHIKDNMRDADKIEIKRSGNHSPEQSLMHGYLHSSICLTLLIEGKPAAMFGVVPNQQSVLCGTIWLLGTSSIEKFPSRFVKTSIICVKTFLEEFDYLENFVDAKYEKSVKWLKIIGAEIYPPIPFGFHKELFHYFCFKKEIDNV